MGAYIWTGAASGPLGGAWGRFSKKCKKSPQSSKKATDRLRVFFPPPLGKWIYPLPAGMAEEGTTTTALDPGLLGPTPTWRVGAARGHPQPRGKGPSQQASPKEVRGSAWSRGKGGHRRPSPGLHQHAAAPYHLGTRAAARTGAATESERSS